MGLGVVYCQMMAADRKTSGSLDLLLAAKSMWGDGLNSGLGLFKLGGY